MPSMVRQSVCLKAWNPVVKHPSRPVLSETPGTQRSKRFTSNTSSSPHQPRQRRWLRITALTTATIGVGAYARSRYLQSDATLNPATFTPYELVSKTPVSATSSIFTLRPVNQEGRNWEVYQLAWQRGLWSVQFKQPQLQIGRDYTPLPPLSSRSVHEDAWDEVDEVDGTLRFLVRKDPHGEVSGYLHSLQPGDTVDIRGPQIEYELPYDVEELLFIAGGTGISPALQAVHTLFRSRGPHIHTRMHILWATRRRDDCLGGHSDLAPAPTVGWWSWIAGGFSRTPPQDTKLSDEPKNITVAQLEDFKTQYPGLLTVDYFVDEEDTLIGKDAILKFTNRRGSASPGGSPTKRLILISGPDGFVGYLAGPKVWENGRETQGALDGLIRQLNLKDWSVWKL